MIEQIKELFHSYKFSSTPLSQGTLFTSGDIKKQEFWVVLPWDGDLEITSLQAGIFEECSAKAKDTALDKNISMILVWPTSGKIERSLLRRQIMSIEEDAYFFKKYVLYYAPTEESSLINKLDGQDIQSFISEQVISKITFAEYKNDPRSYSWQPLLYRLAIKIPFLVVNIETQGNLESLLESNQTAITNDHDPDLLQINDYFFRSSVAPDIAELDAKDLLHALSGDEA